MYFPNGHLPDDIVHVTPESPHEIVVEFIEGLAAAFCGTDVTAPEGSTNWAYSGLNAYTQPLPKEITGDKAAFEKRMEFYRWSVKFSFTQMARHGGMLCVEKFRKSDVFLCHYPPTK